MSFKSWMDSDWKNPNRHFQWTTLFTRSTHIIVIYIIIFNNSIGCNIKENKIYKYTYLYTSIRILIWNETKCMHTQWYKLQNALFHTIIQVSQM